MHVQAGQLHIPASVQIPRTSAPEHCPIFSARDRKLIPRCSDIYRGQRKNREQTMTHTFREWIFRIVILASGLGGGNSIFRSMRPGRRRATSRISTGRKRTVSFKPAKALSCNPPIRLVAMITWPHVSICKERFLNSP